MSFHLEYEGRMLSAFDVLNDSSFFGTRLLGSFLILLQENELGSLKFFLTQFLKSENLSVMGTTFESSGANGNK
jgi:hypothetical protein